MAVVDLHSDGVVELDTDPWGLERGFHDVTIVDMGGLPNRRRLWTSCLFSADNGRQRCSEIWCGYSRTYIRCVHRPRNASVIHDRGIVPTVKSGLNVICIAMWLHITWT